MDDKEKGLFQYKAFFTDETHSYLYFYDKLSAVDLNDMKHGWLEDDDGEFINLEKCKGIRLMREPEGIES